MSLFFGVPVDLAYHLVCWIAAILAPLTGGLATAAAIIAFTVLARLLLLPLSYFAVRGSVRGEGARARLQPRIAELQRRHRTDGDPRGGQRDGRGQRRLRELSLRSGRAELAGARGAQAR